MRPNVLVVAAILAGLAMGIGATACSDASAQTPRGGLAGGQCGPSSHAAQNMTATSITTTATGVSYGVTLDGSRLGLNGSSSTTFVLGTSSAISSYVASTEVFKITATDVRTVGNRYIATNATGTGAPTATDCDADDERGRLYIETTNFRLYVCVNASRGWDYVALTN